MTILTREQALKVRKRAFATVFIPELEGELRLASTSAGTQMALQELKASGRTDATAAMMKLMIEKCVVGEDDKPIFDETSAAEFFSQISLASMDLITNNVPGFVAKKAAKDGEKAEEPISPNSAAAPLAG